MIWKPDDDLIIIELEMALTSDQRTSTPKVLDSDLTQWTLVVTDLSVNLY